MQQNVSVLGHRRLREPSLDRILEFCVRDPIERVFLEDVARRGLGRFTATDRDGDLTALCHVGANVVPSGEDCERFADVAVRGRARMIIGEEAAVTALWEAGRERLPAPRDDRPGQPVYALSEAPAARRRSESTRSSGIRTASAGARARRSRTGARGSGSRTV